MKIMLQNHAFYPVVGGIENYLYYVSKTLKEMGHQPAILCERHDTKLSTYDDYEGISIIRHPHYEIPKPLLFLKPRIFSEKLKHFIGEHIGDTDLIISRYPHYCYATCLLNLNIPILYVPATVHWRYLKKSSESLEVKAKFFNLVWKATLDRMENKCITMANRVLTFSRYISNSLSQYYSCDPERFIVNPPGVDLERFGRSDDPTEIRREFDIPKDGIVVLYVGRLSREKNVGELIKEFRLLKKRNVHLLIVGYGPERLQLEQLRNDSNMIDRIVFVGLRKDVERFYLGADIFVLPSKYEGFGQVILEAMAAGLPCIAFKKASPEYEVASEEIIEDGATGFCVDPYTENEFRDRLLYLIDNQDIRRKMGKAGKENCRRKFTWEAHVKRLLDAAST